MAIGTPTDVGIINFSNLNTIVTTADIPAGALVFIPIYGGQGVSITGTTVTDGTTTYSLVVQSSSNAANFTSGLCAGVTPALIPSGTSFTCAQPSGTAVIGCINYVTGVSGTVDQTNSLNQPGNVVTISLTSGTLSSANEIVIAFLCANGNTPFSYTESSGFTTLGGSYTADAPCSVDVVSSNASVTYAPIFAVAQPTTAVLATFPGIATFATSGQSLIFV